VRAEKQEDTLSGMLLLPSVGELDPGLYDEGFCAREVHRSIVVVGAGGMVRIFVVEVEGMVRTVSVEVEDKVPIAQNMTGDRGTAGHGRA
jgi:hypothetical protein